MATSPEQHADNAMASLSALPDTADRSLEEELVERKTKLAAALRIFGKFGFDEGVAGHITARDPFNEHHFWVNPIGRSFKLMKVSDLIKVNAEGEVIEGGGLLNQAAFAIHSRLHAARPDVIAAAHAHSVYGKSWSSLGRHLDPLTQDACAFYQDHGLFNDFTGVVLDPAEGDRIGEALGQNKAVILRNHGLLTVGHTVDAAAWWFVTMERSCQAQLMAEAAAGTPIPIDDANAKLTAGVVGSQLAGHISFKPLFDVLMEESPDFLE
ncbi:MAG: class II aldolase/adducin family protein [Myxococcota bacterium]